MYVYVYAFRGMCAIQRNVLLKSTIRSLLKNDFMSTRFFFPTKIQSLLVFSISNQRYAIFYGWPFRPLPLVCGVIFAIFTLMLFGELKWKIKEYIEQLLEPIYMQDEPILYAWCTVSWVLPAYGVLIEKLLIGESSSYIVSLLCPDYRCFLWQFAITLRWASSLLTQTLT